ncbi:hypothetical protein MKY84_08975 [Chryseomicrobium sp. FSL W7-1435]|uniref:hypothetical protein n=1 Tax=Chryseomicrobium sp. FSL W7-1435 TaxID=2921704 RepID=UPI003159BE37
MAIELDLYTKENDEWLRALTEEDLKQPIALVKTQIENYIYSAKPEYSTFKVEGFVIELDDIFRFYNLLVGIYVPKAKMKDIDEALKEKWENPEFNYALTFDANEGVAELNLPLDYVEGFSTEFTVQQTIEFIEQLLSTIVLKITK